MLSLITGVLFILVYQIVMVINGMQDLSNIFADRLSDEIKQLNIQMDNIKHASFIKSENIVQRVTENLTQTMAENISDKISENVFQEIKDFDLRVTRLENQFNAIVELAKRLKK